MKEIIKSNPFRILGVYGNATLKEIVANRGRISAFSKVGKKCPFPTDIELLLGPVDRSTEAIQQADSTLTIETDRLRNAMLWFVKSGEADVNAVAAAASGNLDQAIALSDPNSISGLQDRVVFNLIKPDIPAATADFARLYVDHADEMLELWGIKNSTKADLLDDYVTTVMSTYPDPSRLMGSGYPDSWNDAVRLHLAKPLITRLETAIEQCRASKGDTPLRRLAAGTHLSASAIPIIDKLRKILPDTEPKLINICDKVANEMLQSSIDFYNATDDLSAANDALPLAVKAESIAMGSMVSQRVKENLAVLKANAESAPPPEFVPEVTIIRNALSQFEAQPPSMDRVGSLLNAALDPLEALRSGLGDSSSVYVYWSSVVTQYSLGTMINIVNDLQNKVNEAPEGTNLKRGFVNRYISAVRDSYEYLGRLMNLGMDAQCRERFNTNYEVLRDLYFQLCAINLTDGNTGNSVNTNTSGNSTGNSDSNSGCFLQILLYIGILILLNLCR